MRYLIDSTIKELDLDDKQGATQITYLKQLLSPEHMKIPIENGGAMLTLQQIAREIRMRTENSYRCEQALIAWVEDMPLAFQGIREEVDRTIRLMIPNKIKVVNLVRQVKEDMIELEKRNEKLEAENDRLKESIFQLTQNLQHQKNESSEKEEFSIAEPKKKRSFV
ncbi:MAG: initiation-control protein [Siphoviridae sp. ctjeG17]|nr:MAG: initiation-control protein [Siphoviridae sp. ctjeG17]